LKIVKPLTARSLFNEAGREKTRGNNAEGKRAGKNSRHVAGWRGKAKGRSRRAGDGNTIERGGGGGDDYTNRRASGGRNELAGTKGRGLARKREKNGEAEKDDDGTMGGVEFQARRARNTRRILIYPVMIPSCLSFSFLFPLSLTLRI